MGLRWPLGGWVVSVWMAERLEQQVHCRERNGPSGDGMCYLGATVGPTVGTHSHWQQVGGRRHAQPLKPWRRHHAPSALRTVYFCVFSVSAAGWAYTRSAEHRHWCSFPYFPTGVPAGCPLSSQTAHPDPDGAVADADLGEAGLALSRLEGQANFYLQQGIASSTARSYRAAQSRYRGFCSRFSLVPLPASEQTLILFAAELAQELAHSSIRSYLSGVRNLDITRGLADPLPGALRLNLVLKGIRRTKAAPPKVKLPVTPLVLYRLRRVLLWKPADPDKAMIWAACCAGFVGFLRTAEFTVPSSSKFDPSVHLAVQDVAIDSYTSPSLLQIRIKMSKNRPVQAGDDSVFSGLPQRTVPSSSVAVILG